MPSVISSAGEPIRVLVCASTPEELAELQAVIRQSDSLQLVAASLGRETLDSLVASARPDVILDQSGPENSEIPVSAEPADAPPFTILLVADSELTEALAAMRASLPPVRGVLPAWSSDWEIRAAIEAVAEGLIVLHPDFIDRGFGAADPPALARHAASPMQALSPREREILNLLAAGLGNKQIAAQLNISEHTVKFHVTSIFNKLNASTRAEAVAIGARHGLILL
jgi:two-component system, NarL family, response regulator YdfI